MTDIKGFFRSRKTHDRAKLRTVVEMRQARLSQLRARRLSPQEAAVARQEVQALSYVLQCAGVTPDQYAALLSSDTMTPSRGVVLPGDPLYSDTLEPAPSNSPIAPGDVVRSTHPNHRGRLYRVTTVGHGLWGVRLSRTTGRPIGTEQPLKFSMEKMCGMREPATRDRAVGGFSAPPPLALFLLLLFFPANLEARPRPLTAYYPAAVSYSPGVALVRLELGECRSVTQVDWTLRGRRSTKVLGTAEGHSLGVLWFGRPGTYTASFLVRGGNCRGSHGAVTLLVRPLPPRVPPRVPPRLCRKHACACGGWCGPRRVRKVARASRSTSHEAKRAN